MSQAENIRDQLDRCIAERDPPPRLVVWVLATTPTTDLAGAEMLIDVREELARRGIELKLAEARGPMRDVLRAAGLEAHFGPIVANTGVAPTIRQWEASSSASATEE